MVFDLAGSFGGRASVAEWWCACTVLLLFVLGLGGGGPELVDTVLLDVGEVLIDNFIALSSEGCRLRLLELALLRPLDLRPTLSPKPVTPGPPRIS